MFANRTLTAVFFVIGAILVFIMIGLMGTGDEERVANDGVIVSDALSAQEDTSQYARVFEPRAFSFPQDHGPHPDFKNEWWYYTGNLKTGEGRHFGYELTIFRVAMAPDQVERASDWATRQLYMAHFALTDVEQKRFYSFERFNRGALGLAGAVAQPFKVWLEDWAVIGTEGENIFPLKIAAAQDGIALELELDTAKPVVLQGEEGLSQKSAEPGNASYYYSFTRLLSKGEIRVDGQSFQVSGTSWMDREWSTSALSEDQEGWDWFALQLSNNTELMFYHMRKKDGTADVFSGGTFVSATGETHKLSLSQVEVEATDRWQSPHSGIRYPSGWRLSVPELQLSLVITPFQKDQELNLAARYWEGAVQCAGTYSGANITGVGYVELAGYGNGRDEPMR
ncbi:lipocalin-like domain-containing protein [Nitrosococcus wardiae]|uniref:Carotenoid 1,2-hydratase n=1 Tax=Nitrosococcus wardiae TaxID=1814290 RepID=A0A4P7C1K2_9GAMM|nr:lipocalin-like domain-containing protein [Nitrosococcus wardiae]QBQ55344.1 carotenoid 1,2-hydratase [Nitrosococcus wardiae]